METTNFNKFQQISTNFKKGSSSFTLIEIIIAIVVLSIGVFSVIALSGKSYGAISLQKNKLIALNLAREEMEIIRSIRDENWLTTKSCDGLSTCPNYRTEENGGNCDWRCGGKDSERNPNYRLDENLRDVAISTDPGTGEVDIGSEGKDWATGIGATADCFNDGILLKRDNHSSIYQHANGIDSPFHRLIAIDQSIDLNGDGRIENDLQVRIIICWRERGGKQQEIYLEDHLYNWAQKE